MSVSARPTTEPLLLSHGLRPYPGLIDRNGQPLAHGSARRARMEQILAELDEAGFAPETDPDADFEDFWEDATRITSTVRAAQDAGLDCVRADRVRSDPWQPWTTAEMARRLGPVLTIEAGHHRTDTLLNHPFMQDPGLAGRTFHTIGYTHPGELEAAPAELLMPGTTHHLTGTPWEHDCLTRLRLMYWQGHRAAVVKHTGRKIGVARIELTDDIQILQDQLSDAFGWTLVRISGLPGQFQISTWLDMRYEYRLFIVEGRVVTGAGCIEEFTPLDHYPDEWLLDPWVCEVRSNGIAGPVGAEGAVGADTVPSVPEHRPGLAAWYGHYGAQLAEQLPQGQRTVVLDLACVTGREDPVIVELNGLPNAGLYACDADRLARALVAATDRGYGTEIL